MLGRIAPLIGVLCRLEWVEEQRQIFPTYRTVDALLSWSRWFGHSRTWQNYLGYVRTACLVADALVEVSARATFRGWCVLTSVGVCCQVFRHDALKRATAAIRKDSQIEHRPKHFIRRWLLDFPWKCELCVTRLELQGPGGIYGDALQPHEWIGDVGNSVPDGVRVFVASPI